MRWRKGKSDSVRIKGTLMTDSKTKWLCQRLQAGDIAMIDHKNLDVTAAEDLIASQVQAVINLSPFLTGDFWTEGAALLLQENIVLYEIEHTAAVTRDLQELLDGKQIEIINDCLHVLPAEKPIKIALRPFRMSDYEMRAQQAINHEPKHYIQFLTNTLSFLEQEKKLFTASLPAACIRASFANRFVVLVNRGPSARDDLHSLSSFIKKYRPILLAVDGGADVILSCGWVPDVIIGDLDSVSDRALYSGADIILHAYKNGIAPGRSRLDRLGVPYQLLPAPGTSEDVAMLVAYQGQATRIITIGSHTNMQDFLEKGRKGMASTFLIRTRIGHKLIDAKGIHYLIQQKEMYKPSVGAVVASSLCLLLLLLLMHPTIRTVGYMLWTHVSRGMV
ncbi:putative cytokinetic ring protein SteA [Brevibacillus laterosporus]|uniref:putative cytokinetic ring protein SteA n=1 Tax=Brevibacillus laterosporus TaxID=1465 RepID=UPI0026500910|nr:putative cytokinetic ring protein SteA [Brevibacillus laterosporus]MDN9008751.1 putative cytokinetic ring protein SteA [Brevibacillus laterosporus]MDO0940858.1 putative cytokinetic ring protein SteA [Brevibacillus laterosporus]